MSREVFVPNLGQAHIDQRKLTEYLLNPQHPDARGKSAFFCGRYGQSWRRLRDDLLQHAAGPVARVEETRHGVMYVVEGPLAGAPVRSVWIVRIGECFPRLVTAYPFG